MSSHILILSNTKAMLGSGTPDAQGVSDFVNESLKLTYHLLNGYVSIKSIWY